MTGESILVVDDEPNVVKSCVKMLQLEGFNVQGATHGGEAIDLYQSKGFDLVLTDLKMPDTDGLEVLTAIRQHDPRASVVIFTAYGTKENVVEALRLGAREFLEKPLDTRTLVATVRRILEQGRDGVVRGNLASMSLPGIIQVNCTERNQALMRIRHHGQEGRLFFADGNIVHAELGAKRGEEAAYEILEWEEGDFELEKDIAPPERTIDINWSGLLLEGMRRLDERSAELDAADQMREGEAEIGAAGDDAAHEKGVRGDMLKELAKALRQIDSVDGIVITARDGIVLDHNLEEGDPERHGAVAVFLGNAASLAGETLELGRFGWGTVSTGGKTMLVLEQPDFYVGLLLHERVSPAIVVAEAEKTLAAKGA